MTTPKQPSDHPIQTPGPDPDSVRRQCVGSASETAPRAPSESSASGRSLSYETDALNEPPADAPTSASEHPDALANFTPGNRWLLTPRCTPAWTAAYHLLSDHHWHPTAELFNTMQAAADLAPRTIENHLRSASRRRWITRRGEQVRLHDSGALGAALDAMDTAGASITGAAAAADRSLLASRSGMSG